MAESRAMRAGTALALAAFVAGCGGTDFGSGVGTATQSTIPAPAVVRPAVVHRPALRAALLRSATTTRSARTARTSISVTVTGLGEETFATGAFDVAGTGVADLANGDADLVLSVPLIDRVGGGGAIEERIVHGVAYARLPAAMLRVAGLPPPVRWLRIDGPGASAARLSTLSKSQVDPAGVLAFLGEISDDVRPIGIEFVRDTPATHYAATVAPAPVGAASGRRSSLRARLAAIGARRGAGRVGVDVWIDRVGLVRRIVVSIPLSAGTLPAGSGAAPVMQMQTDFYAFGAPVRVTAPPAAQVRPFAALRLPSHAG
jgi:hypothetical protein